ncbi:MAG: phosphate ABC transporter permease PstA [Isosphaeraceae bacterium]|nr:phosphate ABC transporter permease PstA [Isosphaeraceae bacterium]
MSTSPSAETSNFAPLGIRRRVLGPLFASACLLATTTGVVVLVILLGALIGVILRGDVSEPKVIERGGLDLLRFLMTNLQSSNPALAGYKAGIAGSLRLLGIVLCTAIPVGVGTAIYLEEYAADGPMKRLIQTNIANLAAVPSIVYGILGLAVFVRAFGYDRLALGPVLLSGGLTLSLLVLPVLVISTQEALRTVPASLRQAALALGASRWQVIRDHVLPSAMPGILTGTILALSRAIGETAPLLLAGAAGSILRLPRGLMSRYTALPVEIYNYAKEAKPAYQLVTVGGILILVALLLSMNALAILIRNRYSRGPRA